VRNYLFSAVILLLAISFVLLFPSVVNITETSLVNSQIPQNNSAVAGIQKYNTLPVSQNIPFPQVGARAILVKDLATNTLLYQKDINVPFPPASTTKIMTALVASEYFQPNSPLTVSAGAKIGGSSVGLYEGEGLSFRSLLYGMLLPSGNDAAFTIAENYPGGLIGFISAMNRKVTQLNLKNSHFENPAGFDSPNQYASASDLAQITQEALKDSQLSRVFATKETEIVSLDKKYNHRLINLNKLLSQVKGVLGVKTGTTEASKENLITFVERDEHPILVVILGSEDRYTETKNIIEWVYSNFLWNNIQAF
jgi:serine-type D-Ala-D-Ala carboxypeptidase (penicillin-binding protein 5/6)